jgi:hypothetical protein
VTQQKIRKNQTCPDVCVANTLVGGSSPARPTPDRDKCHRTHQRVGQQSQLAMSPIDIAAFLTAQLDDTSYLKAAPAISN